MATKTMPTFRRDGETFDGAEAINQWKNQSVTCACGCHATEKDSISGTSNDLPAKWLGCPNCPGTALGRPLVYYPYRPAR